MTPFWRTVVAGAMEWSIRTRTDCPSRAIPHPCKSGSHNISAPRSGTQPAAGTGGNASAARRAPPQGERPHTEGPASAARPERNPADQHHPPLGPRRRPAKSTRERARKPKSRLGESKKPFYAASTPGPLHQKVFTLVGGGGARPPRQAHRRTARPSPAWRANRRGNCQASASHSSNTSPSPRCPMSSGVSRMANKPPD